MTLATKNRSQRKKVQQFQTLQNQKRKRVKVRSIVDQSYTIPHLTKMGKKQKMLRMATKRNSVGTETPIKSMDKKMRTKRIRRRTRAKEVRAQIKIKEETEEIEMDRKRGRAGERT